MAVGETLATIRPRAFVAENSAVPFQGDGLVAVGLARGVGFPPLVDTAASAVVRLPASADLGGGLVVVLLLADDPLAPCPGLVTKVGVSVGLLGDGTARAIDAAALGTEQTVTLTLGATAGLSKELSVPVPAAVLGSAAASRFVLVRVRRLGSSGDETARGRVVLLGASVLDSTAGAGAGGMGLAFTLAAVSA